MPLFVIFSAFFALLLYSNVVEARSRMGGNPPCTAATKNIPSCAAYKAYLTETLRSAIPPSTNLGPGAADVEFKVLASGRVAIQKASGTSRAHADMAVSIVKTAKLKPPPGPYMLAAQLFRFH